MIIVSVLGLGFGRVISGHERSIWNIIMVNLLAQWTWTTTITAKVPVLREREVVGGFVGVLNFV